MDKSLEKLSKSTENFLKEVESHKLPDQDTKKILSQLKSLQEDIQKAGNAQVAISASQITTFERTFMDIQNLYRRETDKVKAVYKGKGV